MVIHQRCRGLNGATFGAFSVDVLKTRDFSPVEPDLVEFKCYAPGIGVVLETNREAGERVELIDMTTP